MRSIQRAWETVKYTLEYLHLAEFVLHASRSDVLSFLVVAFTHQQGWVLMSTIGAALLCLTQRRSHMKVFNMEEKKQGGAREERMAPETAVAGGGIVPPCVPQTLADLARQGVRVKVVIELHPPSR